MNTFIAGHSYRHGSGAHLHVLGMVDADLRPVLVGLSLDTGRLHALGQDSDAMQGWTEVPVDAAHIGHAVASGPRPALGPQPVENQ